MGMDGNRPNPIVITGSSAPESVQIGLLRAQNGRLRGVVRDLLDIVEPMDSAREDGDEPMLIVAAARAALAERTR